MFEITLPVRFCANCHCSMCRRAHGAAFVTWVGAPADQFRLLEGRDALSNYESSGQAHRSFCSRCGSPLFFESERWPGEVHVARASIPGDVEMPVAAHVYWDDRASWHLVADELPRLGGTSGVEPVAE
jgi:hypothetical protein